MVSPSNECTDFLFLDQIIGTLEAYKFHLLSRIVLQQKKKSSTMILIHLRVLPLPHIIMHGPSALWDKEFHLAKEETLIKLRHFKLSRHWKNRNRKCRKLQALPLQQLAFYFPEAPSFANLSKQSPWAAFVGVGPGCGTRSTIVCSFIEYRKQLPIDSAPLRVISQVMAGHCLDLL